MSEKHLTVVACSYVLEPSILLSRLQALSSKCGVSMCGVVVANRFKEDEHRIKSDWAVIRGSNRVHDFSAYAEGLDYLRSVGKHTDNVLFLNDTLFEKHHPVANLRALLRQFHLLSQVQAPAIVGKSDVYRTACHLNPWSGLNLYISTYCFGLNHAACSILNGIDTFATKDLGPIDGEISSKTWGLGLTAGFREFIRCFLIYEQPDFRWEGRDLHAGDKRLLSVKARCIYSEHRLSGEIGRVGCIFPTNLRRFDRIRMEFYERVSCWMRRMGMESK